MNLETKKDLDIKTGFLEEVKSHKFLDFTSPRLGNDTIFETSDGVKLYFNKLFLLGLGSEFLDTICQCEDKTVELDHSSATVACIFNTIYRLAYDDIMVWFCTWWKTAAWEAKIDVCRTASKWGCDEIYRVGMLYIKRDESPWALTDVIKLVALNKSYKNPLREAADLWICGCSDGKFIGDIPDPKFWEECLILFACKQNEYVVKVFDQKILPYIEKSENPLVQRLIAEINFLYGR